MREIVEHFTVDATMVERFAALTGDRNALHMDEAFARRSRYRERVAHGMLALGQLARLQTHFPHRALRLREIEGRFEAPMPLGTALELAAALPPGEDDHLPFQARWSANGRSVLTASGSFALDDLPETPAGDRGPACLLREPIEEAIRGAQELTDVTEALAFTVSDSAALGLAELMGQPPGSRLAPNLAATLLLSTLVGMRLPGRQATFTAFKLHFSGTLARNTPALLEGRVTKASAASETLIAATRIEAEGETIAEGEIRTLINPLPKQMPSAAELRDRHLALGLAGKVVLIVGASRGIGETTAKLMAMHGAQVIVHYFRGQADAEAIANDIGKAGGTAIAMGCDIRDETAVSRLFDDIAGTFGGLDVLIANAVMDFRPEPATTLDWQALQAELDVSLKGLHACCQAAVPLMKARGGGRILTVSSIATSQPVKGQTKYITAKSAVEGYSKSLAVELARDNIQVNLVVPAMTETDLLAAIPGDFVRRLGQARPSGRNLSPIEVAQAMVYLASDWARGLSGQKLVLNLGEPPFA